MKISIITLTYNSISTVKICFDSYLSQSFHSKELVVIDGYSNDGTLEFLNSCKGYIDSFEVIPAKGLYSALNKGLSLCTGDLICILHSDDLFFSDEVLEKAVKFFESNPSIDLISGNAIFFKKDPFTFSRIYKSKFFKPWMLRYGFMPAHTATIIKKQVFQELGGYNEKFTSAGDFEFFVRLFNCGKYKYAYYDFDFVRMREGGISTSGLRSYIRTSKELLLALRLNGIFSCWLFIASRLIFKFIYMYSHRLLIFLKKFYI